MSFTHLSTDFSLYHMANHLWEERLVLRKYYQFPCKDMSSEAFRKGHFSIMKILDKFICSSFNLDMSGLNKKVKKPPFP